MTGFGGIFLISAGFKVSKSLYFQFQWYNTSRVELGLQVTVDLGNFFNFC